MFGAYFRLSVFCVADEKRELLLGHAFDYVQPAVQFISAK
jgi:hypothetical protein